MLIILMACCLSFAEIQADYYGENSIRVASIYVDSLTLTGDKLNIALNRIARANYKHHRYERAWEIANKVDYEGFDNLKWDTISLKALLAKNTHRLVEADTLFKQVIDGAKSYPDVMYEAHLNYAELKRLESNYNARETQLLLALAFAEGWRKDQVIRVLARHYFMIMLDFDAANKILAEHSRPETLNIEGKIGYKILLAQYNQALQKYELAQSYYIQANQLAKSAGFVGFQIEASDGIMRSMMLVSRQNRNDTQLYIFNAVLWALIIGFGIWNFRLEQKING